MGPAWCKLHCETCPAEYSCVTSSATCREGTVFTALSKECSAVRLDGNCFVQHKTFHGFQRLLFSCVFLCTTRRKSIMGRCSRPTRTSVSLAFVLQQNRLGTCAPKIPQDVNFLGFIHPSSRPTSFSFSAHNLPFSDQPQSYFKLVRGILLVSVTLKVVFSLTKRQKFETHFVSVVSSVVLSLKPAASPFFFFSNIPADFSQTCRKSDPPFCQRFELQM